jgi:cation diffusion facilitator family transporter
MTEFMHSYERKTRLVVFLTAITMVVEISFGLSSKSMALLADGIHMGSHVLAIGLSWLAYIFIRKMDNGSRLQANKEKVLALSGFSSGLILLIFAFAILFEAVQRIYQPQSINYLEAIYIAFIGLAVNFISALILHHKHEHTDHNIKAAYLHVLADALTSITAILGLLSAMIWNISYVDAIAAILSSIIIIKWSVSLLKNAGKELLEIKLIDQQPTK